MGVTFFFLFLCESVVYPFFNLNIYIFVFTTSWKEKKRTGPEGENE